MANFRQPRVVYSHLEKVLKKEREKEGETIAAVFRHSFSCYFCYTLLMEKKETDPNFEKLPKTIFKQVDIDRETELVCRFMEKDRWASVFDKKYPELRKIQKENKDAEECRKKYKEFLEGIHTRDGEVMLSAQEQMQGEWQKIGTAFLLMLSKHFETDWPHDTGEIVGSISVLPVHPRFLDESSFCLGYKDIADMIETSAHEILHFLWFKKWKEVFPEIERKEYESPHLVWRLSEIMDPIILQCQPAIRDLIKPKKWGYASFENINISDVSMTDYFKEIYLQSVASGDNFETTLRKLWRETQIHEKEISTF